MWADLTGEGMDASRLEGKRGLEKKEVEVEVHFCLLVHMIFLSE